MRFYAVSDDLVDNDAVKFLGEYSPFVLDLWSNLSILMVTLLQRSLGILCKTAAGAGHMHGNQPCSPGCRKRSGSHRCSMVLQRSSLQV